MFLTYGVQHKMVELLPCSQPAVVCEAPGFRPARQRMHEDRVSAIGAVAPPGGGCAYGGESDTSVDLCRTFDH
jgi:hypothetical protein